VLRTRTSLFCHASCCCMRCAMSVSWPVLFLQWHGDRRDLHSFPTRRSSDLKKVAAERGVEPLGEIVSYGMVAGPDNPSLNLQPRSEEHTSELQSRENLVCRLLLEKKKKKNKEHTTAHQQMEGRPIWDALPHP